jgi:hypothetical protein
MMNYWELYGKHIGKINLGAFVPGKKRGVFLLKLEPCSKVTIMIINTNGNGNVEVNFYGFKPRQGCTHQYHKFV